MPEIIGKQHWIRKENKRKTILQMQERLVFKIFTHTKVFDMFVKFLKVGSDTSVH